MNHTITITPRRLVMLGIFGLLAVLTYGFAASNTVDPSRAGDGQAAITGYTVTNVHYTLDSTTPSNVSQVSFTVTPGIPAGGAARISLTGAATWLPAGACTVTPGVVSSAVSCTASVAVSTLDNLRVVAAQ